MIADSEVRHAVVVFLQDYFRAFAEGLADAPPDVRESLSRSFVFREASGDPQALSLLEARLPVAMPPALRAFLSVGHFPAIEVGDFTLPGVEPPEPLSAVSRLLLAQELWPAGYLQVGFGPGGDPLCLDVAVSTSSADFPVVVFNHDVIPHGAWASRDRLSAFAVPVAGSFLALLEGLCTGTQGPPWGSAG